MTKIFFYYTNFIFSLLAVYATPLAAMASQQNNAIGTIELQAQTRIELAMHALKNLAHREGSLKNARTLLIPIFKLDSASPETKETVIEKLIFLQHMHYLIQERQAKQKRN